MFLYRLAVVAGRARPRDSLAHRAHSHRRRERLAAFCASMARSCPSSGISTCCFCARFLVAERVEGLKPGFMISPSVDGQAPTMLAQLVRRSRRARLRLVHRRARRARRPSGDREGGHLAGITPDGPRGPRFEFKPGAIFTAQITGKPVVPIAYAAKPAWVLKTGTSSSFRRRSRASASRSASRTFRLKSSTSEMEEAQREMERRLHETYREAQRDSGASGLRT